MRFGRLVVNQPAGNCQLPQRLYTCTRPSILMQFRSARIESSTFRVVPRCVKLAALDDQARLGITTGPVYFAHCVDTSGNTA